MKTQVVNLKNLPYDKVIQNYQQIDRNTRWGNIFKIGIHGTREEVIEKYRLKLWRDIRAGNISLEDLASLHGKTLACWCKPLPCHGDVLAKAAAWAKEKLK